MALGYKLVRQLRGKTVVDITLDNAYPAGGYALSAASLGMIDTPDIVDPVVATGQGLTPQWVAATNKLKMFKSAAVAGQHAECVAADLSNAVVVRCEVTGRPA